MKNKFVKIICAIVCFAIAVGIFTPAAIEFGKKKIENDALENCLAVAKMCRDNKEDYEEQLAKSDETLMAIPTRLIVETKRKLDLPEGTEVIYGDDAAYVQCKSSEIAEELKQRLTQEGYEVCNDYLAKVIAAEETEPSYSYPTDWGYTRIESADAVAKLTDAQKSRQITVMVVDTGVNYSLLGFKNRIIDYSINLSTSGTEGSAKDDNGHGTCVSSVIVKTTPDNVKLIAVKLINSDGQFYLSEFEDTLDYLAKLTTKPDVINMSLTFPTLQVGPNSFARVNKKCAALVEQGSVCVAAAGNESANNAPNLHPAACEEFITVAGSQYGNDMADFTNYNVTGDHCIDIAAPGKKINMFSMTSSIIETTGDGTSFASPMVAAAAAIVLMQNPEMTVEEVTQRICERAMPFKVHKNYGANSNVWTNCRWGGYGILNMYNLIDGERVGDVDWEVVSSKLDCSDMKIKLTCSQPGAVIYYTTDGTRPTTSSQVYTEPISITSFTRIFAVAYYGNLLHSYYAVAEVGPYVMPENDSDYLQIDSRGYITGYTGNRTSFIIDMPDNKIIRGIAEGAFEDSSVRYLELTNSCRYIESNAFKNSAIEEIISNNSYILQESDSSDMNLILDPETYLPTTTNTFHGVESVGDSAFEGCTNLQTADFTNLLIAGTNAFKDCTSLTDMTAKYCTVIKEGAFMNTALTEFSMPYCTEVPDYAFYGSEPYTISLPNAKTVGSYAFKCDNLTSIDISKVEKFEGENNFINCINLEKLELPLSVNLPSFSFDSGLVYAELKSIYAPKSVEFCAGKSNLLPFKELEYIYAPYLKTIGDDVALPGTLLFTTSSLETAGGKHNSKLTVMGYDNTYAKEWASTEGYKFVSLDSHKLNFDSLTEDYCTYTCSDCSEIISFPREIMDKEYSQSFINQRVTSENYIIMFDLVPDGYINAKDYAQYLRLTKNQ